jgi:5-oxoprolinase (ATP-hydrolysing) subunit A
MGRLTVDLNADVGEEKGDDTALIPYLSSANIACGCHAGNPAAMSTAIECAARNGVAAGAHPGFADREHFGRRELDMASSDIEALVARQIDTLAAIAATHTIRLTHLKPHGALYNMAARDASIADAIARATAAADPALVLFGLAGSRLIEAGQRAGLRTASEVFADRGYRGDGSLVPRTEPGALLDDADEVVRRAIGMVRDGFVRAVDGTIVRLAVDTICIHGDTPGAVLFASSLRAGLTEAGIEVTAPSR